MRQFEAGHESDWRHRRKLFLSRIRTFYIGNSSAVIRSHPDFGLVPIRPGRDRTNDGPVRATHKLSLDLSPGLQACDLTFEYG